MLIRARSPKNTGLPISIAGAISVLVLFLGGSLISLLLYHNALEGRRRDLQAATSMQAKHSTQLLQTKLACSLEILRSVVSLFQSQPNISRSAFRDFVADALRRQPEIQALGWSPRVPAAERIAAETALRQQGITSFCFVEKDNGGRIVAAAQRSEYFPVYYIEPFSENKAASGFALESNAIREAALSRCCDTAAATATPPIRLLQAQDGEPGFIVYVPLYHRDDSELQSVQQRRAALGGFASAVFRLDHLLDASLAELKAQQLSVTVTDRAGGTVLFENGLAASEAEGVSAGASLHVAGRQWELLLQPTAGYIASHSTGQPMVVLGVGLVITLLLSGSVYGPLRRARLIEQRVIDRTRQLSAEISERKRAEASVRLAEAKYRSIFENSVEGIFQTTPQGQYISANKALAVMYGYESVKQLMSDLESIAHQLYVDPSRRDQFIQQIQRDGEVTAFESQIRRRDGKAIWISESARTVRDEKGKLLYYEGAVADTTERRQHEDQLRHRSEELERRVRQRTAELAATNDALTTASRAKSDFLASMSHEIRTPMNAILGYAQLLLADPKLTAEQREAVSTVFDSGTHLIAVVNDVLDIAKIEAGATAVQNAGFNLTTMLASIGSMFRQKCQAKSIALRLETPPNSFCYVHGDERRLRQVLINLLGNAVKFTDQGSIILSVAGTRAGAYTFEVIDTGIGIAREAQAGIFEPFRQAASGEARGGTGLGLAIAKQLVSLMGGTLNLSSESGQGARFYFEIPLAAVDSAETNVQAVVDEATETDWAASEMVSVHLPDELRNRLRAAAEVYSVTDIKHCLGEIEHIGSDGIELARLVRGCVHRYDMAAILRLLEAEPAPA